MPEAPAVLVPQEPAATAPVPPTPAPMAATQPMDKPVAGMSKDELVVHLQECIRSGEEYRNQFRPSWEETEQQIRCKEPAAWSEKETWQTKVFIPMQAKKEEIAVAYLKKMIFGRGRFFGVQGNESGDIEEAQNLTRLIEIILQIGSFEEANDFVLTEAIGSPGSSFLKILKRQDGYLNLVWRSPYNVLIDPECGQRLGKSRFIIDCYKKDLAYFIANSRKEGQLYYDGRGEVDAFLKMAEEEAKSAAKVASEARSNVTSEAMMVVKGIDGTTDVTIPAKYKQLDLHECWVQVPSSDGTYEYRVVALLNKTHIIRDKINKFGFQPWIGCRTKPRKYDWYGRGYLENGRGFQELANSMVCLGFDSAKINSMDIIVMDQSGIYDSTSIKYKPLAIWKGKKPPDQWVKFTRGNGVSAMTDIIRGLQLIDQLDQDASGITRQVQGAPALSGAGGQSGNTETGTLGEFQLQLQLSDQRFLDQGRFIEHDYVVPLVQSIYQIIINEELFTQELVDKLIGTREVDNVTLEMDPVTQTMKSKVIGTRTVPKLDLKKLRAKGPMAYNFKATGITQFTQRSEQVQKIKEGLQAATSNPILGQLTKIPELWKRLWQLSDIEDHDQFLKTAEEIKADLEAQRQNTPPVQPGAQNKPVPAGAPNG